MLTLPTIVQLKTLLLSERVHIGGHELQAVAGLVQELHNEEQRLRTAMRLRPQTPTVEGSAEPSQPLSSAG